ncbi:MAG: type II secretion system F family protein [Pirellulales bacterium]
MNTTSTAKLTLDQQIAVCVQIAQIAGTKLPIEQQLAQLAELNGGKLSDSASIVQQRLLQGRSLSDSLKGTDSNQSRILAACVEAGQVSNRLDNALQHWTAMHIANAQSSKRLGAAMVYPSMLIAILLLSIGFTAWHLIPEIHATYQQFEMSLPQWLSLLVWTRQHFFALMSLITIATILPLAGWFLRRFRKDSFGLPKLAAPRLRLQALATSLSQMQLAASRPISESLPRSMSAMGLSQELADSAFNNLQKQQALHPLPTETSLLLSSLYAGVIDQAKAVELLGRISTQLNFQADAMSLRESRWLPMMVSIVVCIVTVATYVLLVYLPWVELLLRIVQA